MDIESLKNMIIEKLLKENPERYQHHIQYVVKIGTALAKRYGANETVVEFACLLHDIGRGFEEQGENHSEAGVRISRNILLETYAINDHERGIILWSIKYHHRSGIRSAPYFLEEKILRTADGASKVLYHDEFLQLCKKITSEEKYRWGLKRLEKGFGNILIPEFKEEVRPVYEKLKATY